MITDHLYPFIAHVMARYKCLQALHTVHVAAIPASVRGICQTAGRKRADCPGETRVMRDDKRCPFWNRTLFDSVFELHPSRLMHVPRPDVSK